MPIENKPHRVSPSALAHLDGPLDQALEQTFPASDAVAIDIERESHFRKARVLDFRILRAGKRKAGQTTAQKERPARGAAVREPPSRRRVLARR